LVQSSDSKLNLKKPSTHQTEPEAVHPVFGAVSPNHSQFELAEHTHLFHDHRITIHNAECGSMYLNLELQIVPSFAPWIIIKIVVKPAKTSLTRGYMASVSTTPSRYPLEAAFIYQIFWPLEQVSLFMAPPSLNCCPATAYHRVFASRFAAIPHPKPPYRQAEFQSVENASAMLLLDQIIAGRSVGTTQ
jgi:hypothetical protein